MENAVDNVMDNDQLSFILSEGIQFLPAKQCLVNQTGTIISLSENSYRFLLLLLNGETDKQNIINEVWREQRGSVSDSSYYGQIYMLRKAFELAGLPGSLIKTIPRRGVKYMGRFDKRKVDPDLVVEMGNVQAVEDDNYLPQKIKLNNDREPAGSQPQQPNRSEPHMEWFHSKRWNLLISILAVLAVCWLTSLGVGIVYLFF